MPVPKKILSRKDEIAADFLKLMDKHIDSLLSGKATKRYCATDYAKLLFIHPRHLTNTLHEATGKSPCDYMEERITLEAKKLLDDRKLSIADVGAVFGYDDASNFTKFFKGMTGVTPRAYRKGDG